MAKEKKGGLGGILNAIANEIMESDDSKTAAPAVAAPSVSRPVPVISSLGASVPLAASTPSIVPSFASQPIDPETVKMVQNEVLVENVNGHASNFLKFLKIWNAMKQTSDISTVISVLQATDPSVTVEAIATDLALHKSLLEQNVSKTNSDLDAASKSALTDITASLEKLAAANATAEKEIARHQSETQTRNAEIASLQAKAAETTAKIDAGRIRATAAQDAVRNDLSRMEQFFPKL